MSKSACNSFQACATKLLLPPLRCCTCQSPPDSPHNSYTSNTEPRRTDQKSTEGVQHLFRVAAQHATRQKGACMPETCRIAFAQLRALHPPCTVHQYQQWCPAVYKFHRILVCCIPCCSRACTRTSGGCDTLEAAHAFRVMHTHDVGGATRQTWLWRGDLLSAYRWSVSSNKPKRASK